MSSTPQNFVAPALSIAKADIATDLTTETEETQSGHFNVQTPFT
jgi:hypothetical protein